MSEDYLIRNCAPTLANLKTASLFTCPCENRALLLSALRRLNRLLSRKGLRLLPLRFSDRKALLYLYRPARLSRDLQVDTAAQLLRCRGYDPERCEQCVARLSRKLKADPEFPHEIGLFLGYPAEDVQGFIEHGPDCAKCTGCWKVYSDEESARKTFDQYKKCTRVYCDRWAQHNDIERLTVPTKAG
ncbi:MAG: DUF3793 family protein [Oscillospiraceae bacterium]|nr:DUF3793 family protein [Oscillospiraceae bacterium]